MKILLKIMYDGTDFCGWQIQPNCCSIQGEITKAIKQLTNEDVSLVGSGRTDSKVHALAQFASFSLNKPFDINKIISGLNFYLPVTIRIVKAQTVDENFNARFYAISKTYKYFFYLSDIPNPIFNNKALAVKQVNIKNMQAAALIFEGAYDYKAFMSSGSEVKTTVRTVFKSRITKKNGLYVYEVCANGFLYNMVRKMMAALLMVGEGKLKPLDIKRILNSDTVVQQIAPAHALYLADVQY